MKIALIDDELSELTDTLDALKNEGWEVEEFDNVDIFYDKVISKIQTFDLLIIDILLPDGDNIKSKSGTGEDTGVVLIKKIFELQITINRFIPIAVLTQLDTDDIRDAIELSVDSLPDEMKPNGIWKVWSKSTGSAEFARKLSIWFHQTICDHGVKFIGDGWDLLNTQQKWNLLKLFSDMKYSD